MINPNIRGLGETVLRVKDLARMKDFYERVIGLELMKEFDGIAFFRIADGYGGHTQILGMFAESRPVPIPQARRQPVAAVATSLHHFAFEIDRAHYNEELTRLRALGLTVTTAVHGWCHWRSIYVLDPEENIIELVCFDDTVR
jgi:catechol 2,3-dioxygenase-like lactoylglutathione lyase family enzyme